MEEGKKIINYSVGVQGIPISMGIGIQSLNIIFGMLWPAVESTQDYHNKFYMLRTYAFRGQEIDATSSTNLPFCKCQLPTRNLTGHTGNNVRVKPPEHLLRSLVKKTSLIAACKASLKENILTQNWDGTDILQMELLKPDFLLTNLFNDMKLHVRSSPAIWQFSSE